MKHGVEFVAGGQQQGGSSQATTVGEALMKSILLVSLAVLAVCPLSAAKDLPDAPSAVVAAAPIEIQPATPAPAVKATPETKTVDTTFVSLAIISTGSNGTSSFRISPCRSSERWRR